ncbi:hypothetical protein OQ620_29450, partial [Klebsiella pneumoniae]|nr:hypothetical protein [Klebsiella pneumoniae]
FGRAMTAADIDAIYAAFMPLQIAKVVDFSAPIAGVVDTIAAFRAEGLKIGSCSGYPRPVMEKLVPAAAAQGYAPDHWVATDDLAVGAKRGDSVDNAGNRCGKIDNLSDLQRHKRGVDRIDIGGSHRAAEFGLPAAIDSGEFAQRLNVLPLAKPHRHAGLFKGYLNI